MRYNTSQRLHVTERVKITENSHGKCYKLSND